MLRVYKHYSKMSIDVNVAEDIKDLVKWDLSGIDDVHFDPKVQMSDYPEQMAYLKLKWPDIHFAQYRSYNSSGHSI